MMPSTNGNRHLTRFTFFFALAYLTIENASSTEIFYEMDSAINQGLLSNSYWRNRSMESSSQKIIAFSDVKFGAITEIANTKVLVEREKVSTLITNGNALFAASTSDQILSNAKNGSYPLNGRLSSYEFDAIGIIFTNELVRNDFSWSITPKVVRINTMSTGSGDGLLQIDNNYQTITGTTNRQGLSPFGFLTNPDRLQIGIGGTLDIQASYFLNTNNKIESEVRNVISSVPVSGVFHSERNYQVNALNNELIFSAVPSLTGTYGQSNKNLKLPQVIKTNWTSQEFGSRWSKKLGVIAFDDNKILFGEVGYKYGESSFVFKTYELQNVFLTYLKNNFLLNNLSAEVTIGSAFHSNSQLMLTGLRYLF